MTKSKIMISHGQVTHKFSERYDCLDCIQVEIKWLQALKKAGGQTKFLKALEKKVK